MKNLILIFIVLSFIAILSGCAPPSKMYHYGNYSQTLYYCEKNQDEKSLVNHRHELEEIIIQSEVKKLPVPPGIYAELGYIHLKNNTLKEAIKLFELESKLYPESSLLMGRLIDNAKEELDSENNLSKINTQKTAI